jgi:hypothetical protein
MVYRVLSMLLLKWLVFFKLQNNNNQQKICILNWLISRKLCYYKLTSMKGFLLYMNDKLPNQNLEFVVQLIFF